MVVAGIKGSLVQGIDSLYDTLLVPALDEVSSEYGLLAEAVSYPDDFSSATFRLRAEAKWHDGKPVTPDDVIFSFNAFKKFSPQAAADYRHVVKAEKTGDREITFTFDGAGNRELPQIVGQLTVLPKEWWEGTDKDGKKRSIGETTLEPPLGSGPTASRNSRPAATSSTSASRTIGAKTSTSISAATISTSCGSNISAMRRSPSRRSRRTRSTGAPRTAPRTGPPPTISPAVKEKRVILEEFPINNVGIMQAFAFNIRRDKFKDPRVRLAFNYAFDFEEMNKQIFFGQYKRIASYFEGTELAATGLPNRPRARTSGNGARQGSRRSVHIRPIPIQSAAIPTRCATICARPCGSSGRPVTRCANQQLVNAKTGEPFTVEFLSQCAALRARLFVLQALARTPRHHRVGAHGR